MYTLCSIHNRYEVKISINIAQITLHGVSIKRLRKREEKLVKSLELEKIQKKWILM